MNEKLKELNCDLDDFIEILFFFNTHFNQFGKKNDFYYFHLSRRYVDFLNKKEKILEGIK